MNKIRVIIAVTLLILASGCASSKELTKGFMGVSTKELENGRSSAIKKNFNFDYFSCYTKTLDGLKLIGAYTYVQDVKKHMIAVYVSEADTTSLGFFFTELDSANTTVEVSSLSIYAKEKLSKQIFDFLDGKPMKLKD